jgi:cytochrome c peroxidase
VVATVRKIAGYKPLFAKAFGSEEIDLDRIAKAIATYERTVLSGNAPYDRYKAGNKKAMTAAQIRGMDVYFGKAKCDQCHEGINFTTNAYHNLGARTAPYMHDGSLKTLEEVVDYYDQGGTPNKNLDERMKKLNLTAAEKKDLVEFMKALSGEGWQAKLVPPASFPK